MVGKDKGYTDEDQIVEPFSHSKGIPNNTLKPAKKGWSYMKDQYMRGQEDV